MCKVITQFKIHKYTVLKLSEPVPNKKYNKYRIGEKEYDVVPSYDLINCITVQADEDFIDKIVEFI